MIDAIFKAPDDTAALNPSNWVSLAAAGGGNYYVKFTVTEPLFLSPVLLGSSSKEDHCGMFGINALNFTINFSPSANRAWRAAKFVNPVTALPAAGTLPVYQTKTATLINVSNASMFVKFYTPKATMLDNPRCVVPYHEYQIFKSSNNNNVLNPVLATNAGGVVDPRFYGLVTTSTNVNDAAGSTITSNNIQLQSIPERIFSLCQKNQR